MASAAKRGEQYSQLTELEVQMKNGTPDRCLYLSHSAPSVQMFYALRQRLETSSEAWLREFLELGGLSSLLDSLRHMTGRGFTSFSDAILQLDCISCVRAILNTNIGLDFMARNDEYTPKLALALNTNNTLPKKQVLEMMSAICAYNNLGYQTVLTALSYLKKETDQAHRFSVIIYELKSAETEAHKTAVLTFINCVINCTPDVVERNRLRNEFVGLDLLDILSFMRKGETDDTLHLQLEKFHEKKHDDEEILSQEHQVDFNSPEDLVDMIQSKIFGSPKMVSFVNILQDMLAIDTVYHKNSIQIWKTLDNLVHRSIHMCECDRMMTSPTQMNLDLLPDDFDNGLQYIMNYQVQVNIKEDTSSKPKNHPSNQLHENNIEIKLEMGEFEDMKKQQDNDTGVELTHNRSKYSLSGYDNVFLDSTVDTPTNKSALQRRYLIQKYPEPPPSKKMRHLPWVKFMDHVLDKYDDCIWKTMPGNRRLVPDYNQLEKLFCNYDNLENENEVVLLSPQTRRNLNLFLSRMEINPEDLIQSLETGNSVVVNLPTLQYLLKVLPEPEEIALLQSYNGRRLSLGLPEQFVLLLADIPDYYILIQGLLTKAEYTSNLQKLKSSLNVMNMMCKKILDHKQLQEFLNFILHVGNFLNHGFLQGDAMGFKMTSLERLMEMKSTVCSVTLLHHVVKYIEEKDKHVLQFVSDLLPLEKAVSSSLNNLKSEVTTFNKQLCHFIQLLATANHRLKERFQSFIDEVKSELKSLQQSTNLLREMTQKLANYFCEDLSQFDIEMTLRSLHSFCQKIKRCQSDNEAFKKQSQLAVKRKDHMTSHLKKRLMSLEFGKDARASSSMMEDRNQVLEKILEDLHRGNFRPVVKSEVHTPETDMEVLEFSNISFIDSPYARRPSCEVLEEDFMSPPGTSANFRTSSAADILSEESRPESQEAAAKETPPELPRKMSQDTNHAMDEVVVDRRMEMVRRQAVKQRVSHNRSRSDLTDSIFVMEKWIKYEELKYQACLHEEQPAPLAEPESMCAISSLNLENNGRAVDREDVKYYEGHQYEEQEAFCALEEGPVVKLPLEELQIPELKTNTRMPKRKTSVSNFFNKISRAVLKPRNVYAETVPGQTTKLFGRFGRRRTTTSLADKENIDAISQHSDKLNGMKDYKKHKGLKKYRN